MLSANYQLRFSCQENRYKQLCINCILYFSQTHDGKPDRSQAYSHLSNFIKRKIGCT